MGLMDKFRKAKSKTEESQPSEKNEIANEKLKDKTLGRCPTPRWGLAPRPLFGVFQFGC